MKTIEWLDGAVRFLDQTRLPHEEVYVTTKDPAVVAEAIRALRIRGAPAIGVAAAYGTVLAAVPPPGPGPSADPRACVTGAIALLRGTRPTAVNLFHALGRMAKTLERCDRENDLAGALLAEARAIHAEDVEACRRIGELGAALLRPGTSVLTHCNAGALATSGIGTALGVIVTAHRQGKIARVFAGETRPLLQGARLTTFELLRAGIDVTLITDNAAGLVMARGLVQAVIVGADRIAANGDTANKIGTYPLAVLAHRHNIPFYVAAPSSSIDPSTAGGDAIVIEERDPTEVTRIGTVAFAPEGVQVYAPAFDITPNELISAIVTESGVLVPPYSRSIAGI